MLKNTAGQKVGAMMVSASDGSAFTGSVTVSVTVDAGTQATGSVGSGACTHEGNGYHTYAPAQAETNGDLIAFTFTGTGAVPQTVQIYTVNVLQTVAQTGDSYARLGAPAGASVSADIAAVKTDTGTLVTRITSTLFSGITSLAQWLGLLAGKQAGNSTARTELRATGGGSGTFDETTDSQEALRDRGDAAWTTAVGFATHSAADVWAVATRVLTAGTNIVLAKGTGLTGLNDLDAAGVRSAVGLASANLDTQLAALSQFLDTEIADILTDTSTTLDDMLNNLEGRLTAALATALQAHALGIGLGVVDAGSSTTDVVIKSVNGGAASGTDDFYNGRSIVFTSGALALQGCSIADYTGASKTATVSALTNAPSEDDTFVIV